MVGRSMPDTSDQMVQSAEVNMPLRLDIEAVDRPTILCMIYRMVSVQ